MACERLKKTLSVLVSYSGTFVWQIQRDIVDALMAFTQPSFSTQGEEGRHHFVVLSILSCHIGNFCLLLSAFVVCCISCSPQQQPVDTDDEGTAALPSQVPVCLHEWSSSAVRVSAPTISSSHKRGRRCLIEK